MPSLTCSTCGMVNEGGRFCGRCGQPLAAPASPTPPTAAPASPTPPVAAIACPRCGLAVAANVAFCGRCGQAIAGSSAPMPAFARATPAQVAQATPHKTRKRAPWPTLIGMVGIVAAVLTVLAQSTHITPTPPCVQVACPVPPGQPAPPLGPVGPPLPAPAKYTDTAIGYSFEYPSFMPAPSASQQLQNAVGWSATFKDGSNVVIDVAGQSTSNTAQQVVQSFQQSAIPNATLVYAIPDAEVGYVLGYGAVYDAITTPQSGQQQETRFVVEAAVQNGISVLITGASPFIPDKSEHPAPAQMEPGVEQIVDTVGNTVTWPGESQL